MLIIAALELTILWQRLEGICTEFAIGQYQYILCVSFAVAAIALGFRRLLLGTFSSVELSASVSLVLAEGIALASYVLAPEGTEMRQEPLVFFGGILASEICAACFFSQSETVKFNIITGTQLFLITVLLPLTFYRDTYEKVFTHGVERRWSGPWNSPNSYGTILGIGIVFSLGLALNLRGKIKIQSENYRIGPVLFKNLIFPLWVYLGIASSALTFGLIKSQSRGAATATALGILYLLMRRLGSARLLGSPRRLYGALHGTLKNIKNQSIFAGTFLLIVVLFGFYTDIFKFLPAVISRTTVESGGVDQSIYNRLIAWESAYSVISDSPWIGYGWESPRRIYEAFYSPVWIANGGAILTNDYLYFAISAGFLALFLIVWYIFVSVGADGGDSLRLRRGEDTKYIENIVDARENLISSVSITRAGAIVIIIGSIFNPIMFNWAFSILLWTFLMAK